MTNFRNAFYHHTVTKESCYETPAEVSRVLEEIMMKVGYEDRNYSVSASNHKAVIDVHHNDDGDSSGIDDSDVERTFSYIERKELLEKIKVVDYDFEGAKAGFIVISDT